MSSSNVDFAATTTFTPLHSSSNLRQAYSNTVLATAKGKLDDDFELDIDTTSVNSPSVSRKRARARGQADLEQLQGQTLRKQSIPYTSRTTDIDIEQACADLLLESRPRKKPSKTAAVRAKQYNHPHSPQSPSHIAKHPKLHSGSASGSGSPLQQFSPTSLGPLSPAPITPAQSVSSSPAANLQPDGSMDTIADAIKLLAIDGTKNGQNNSFSSFHGSDSMDDEMETGQPDLEDMIKEVCRHALQSLVAVRQAKATTREIVDAKQATEARARKAHRDSQFGSFGAVHNQVDTTDTAHLGPGIQKISDLFAEAASELDSATAMMGFLQGSLEDTRERVRDEILKH